MFQARTMHLRRNKSVNANIRFWLRGHLIVSATKRVIMNDTKMIPIEEFSERSGRDQEKIIGMIREGFYNGRLEEEKWMIAETDLEKIEDKNEPTPEPGKAYIILENGKKHYIKATTVDIVFSIFIPFWGFVFGIAALLRGETKRGQTMAIIGFIGLLIFVATRMQ